MARVDYILVWLVKPRIQTYVLNCYAKLSPYTIWLHPQVYYLEEQNDSVLMWPEQYDKLLCHNPN